MTISVSRDCPDAFVDPSLALEILVNLVENAHRASPGAAGIELAATCVDARVRLEVLDRGPGVALESDVVRHGLGLEVSFAEAIAALANQSTASKYFKEFDWSSC